VRLAATAGPVLIQGEPGAGKEAVARSLHQHSGRLGPFVAVNSAAIAPRGMEEQLFGSDAPGSGPAAGRFEEADGGVLFLDEVADLQPEVQARLVRVVQEQRFTRVGGRQPVHVDVRVVAATNQDLDTLVQEGAFRSDLYYRLNVFPLRVPPLREHPEDIPELVEHFLGRHTQRQGMAPRTFSAEALAALREYDWPGNVRELENVVERILILSEAEPVGTAEVAAALGRAPRPAPGHGLFEEPLRQAREDFEREYLAHQLRAAGGNMTQVAELSGLERTHLYRKVRQLGLDPADYKGGGHGD
jgi:DNA-binding NtrC family response regulator